MKKFEKWTFDELVDYWAGRILMGLLAGEFKSTVRQAIESTIRWWDSQPKDQSK